MRKLDKFIIQSFIGPFLLTTGLATFILLIQYMLKYFDDFVGKNLGWQVFSELIFYFSLKMLEVALPLGVLVSSLMTFGNLGEQFELTAIKSSGISLVRALRPIFFFVVILAIAAFQFNNVVIPYTNLKAYSLLYDIKHKKAALNITEGVFYNEIPNYNIYVKKKYSDNKTLKDVLIYDHSEGNGNRRVIMADSSLMYTILNEKYLKLEMYNGHYYSEEEKKREPVDQLFRSEFERMDMVFNLSSFDLQRTKKELFENNRQMKNVAQLKRGVDSIKQVMMDAKKSLLVNVSPSYKYFMKSRGRDLQQRYLIDESKRIVKDTIQDVPDKNELPDTVGVEQDTVDGVEQDTVEIAKESIAKPVVTTATVGKRMMAKGDESPMKPRLPKRDLNHEMPDENAKPKRGVSPSDTLNWEDVDQMGWAFLDSVQKVKTRDVLLYAKNNAQNVKMNLSSSKSRMYTLVRDLSKYVIEMHKKYSQAAACIVMFLIGAPLGAIIKKGGLGVPVIISISFFLTYYVISIMCAKWSHAGQMNPIVASWLSVVILLPFGLFFLRQARIDARLFEMDFYNIWMDKLKNRFTKEKK